ncbi:MAG: TIGR01777 family oxidoreductase [Pyrinomonadaceae bacterium]|nr:TIGR01777 family oxidoreductase [Pyrinomonadaceae bacterium]MCX7640773.1 TIGR01777 family oxidoreductase [Pyrinomonadaceae bacterium]MDW8304668.1 TIGR01777 family oxidoreductase [Acidobacteriota bacterium]
MRILISGATGLVGKSLISNLQGHEVFKLVRKGTGDKNEIIWDAERGFSESEEAKLTGFDAVINLAGDNVASQRWTPEKKQRIRLSRTLGTKNLVEALKRRNVNPKVFISASAIGFYGNRGDEVLTEESSPGEGFFPEVCQQWETEAKRAEELGSRVVLLRIGIVLAKEGGALKKMLLPFRLGLGGVVGSGNQWMSWIALEDLIRIILFVLEKDKIKGPFNCTSPNPVTNLEFTKTLGKVLSRPTLIPVPALAIKFLFGEMGEALLLESTRVIPKRLQQEGFKFSHPNLEDALRSLLK